MEMGIVCSLLYYGIGLACILCRLSDWRIICMINWQEWVVGVLVVLCIARIIYGIFLFFRRTRENKNPCDSCVSGCELKDMLEKKRKECGVKKKSTKKNCCG